MWQPQDSQIHSIRNLILPLEQELQSICYTENDSEVSLLNLKIFLEKVTKKQIFVSLDNDIEGIPMSICSVLVENLIFWYKDEFENWYYAQVIE